MGLFAQDQWTLKRLTANYGVRIDFLKASVDPQDIAAGPFTPARHYDGVSNVPNWKDISPRLGAAYDLFGNGKTALKASFGRYVVADAYTVARAVNPETTRGSSHDADVERHHQLQPVPATATSGTRWRTARAARWQQPDLRHLRSRRRRFTTRSIVQGWGVRPFNWETQFSIQQQVAPRVSVYAGYSRRSFGNLFATKNTAVTNASYTPYCIGVPTAPSITGLPLPNAGGQQCGYFDLIRPTTQAQRHPVGRKLRRRRGRV